MQSKLLKLCAKKSNVKYLKTGVASTPRPIQNLLGREGVVNIFFSPQIKTFFIEFLGCATRPLFWFFSHRLC